MNWEPTGKNGGASQGKKRRGCFIAAAVVVALVVVAGISRCAGGESGSTLEWPSSGLAAMLPMPDSNKGSVIINDNEKFSASVGAYTQEKFDAYVAQCQEKGFSVEASADTDEFDAYTEDGHHLTLQFYDSLENMDIELVAPIEMATIAWPTSGAGALAPAPVSTTGKIESDSSGFFQAYIGETSVDDFAAYVDACIAAGFSVDYNKADESFYANNADGVGITVNYLGNNTMEIIVNAPDDAGDATDAAPESAESSETSEEPAPTTDPGGIDPNFKATMDGYEAFMNEYVDFMNTYNSDPNNVVSMLTQYNEMMQEYSDYMSTIGSIDESALSGADLQYYLDVTSRVNQRLLEVAQ